MPLFEVADDHQATPLEVGERDGRPILRLRRGAEVTDELVAELNELIGPQRDDRAAPQHRPVVVLVVG